MPTINIRYGKLIDPFFKGFIAHKYPGFEFLTDEQVQTQIALYKTAYKERGVALIEQMLLYTGLSFQRNVIDCFIVTATNRDMSAPLIIRARYTANEFLEALLHELAHILITDNGKKLNLKLHENKTIENHIPVYAIMRQLGFTTEPTAADYKEAFRLSKEFVFPVV